MDYRPLIYGLIIVAFVISVLCYILSAIYRRALFRFIPCCNKQGNPEIVVQILRLLIIFILTFAYSSISLYCNSPAELLFVYRMFNRLYHAPFTSSLEAFILFIYMIIQGDLAFEHSLVYILFAIHILLHRLMIFGNKCLYVLISIVTAYRNKKQRFKL